MRSMIGSVLLLIAVAAAVSNALPYRDHDAMASLALTVFGLSSIYLEVAALVFTRLALPAYVAVAAMSDYLRRGVSPGVMRGFLAFAGAVSVVVTITPLISYLGGSPALPYLGGMFAVFLTYAYLIIYVPWLALYTYPAASGAPPLRWPGWLLAGVAAFVAAGAAGTLTNYLLTYLRGPYGADIYLGSVTALSPSSPAALFPIWTWGDVIAAVVAAVVLRGLYDVLLD